MVSMFSHGNYITLGNGCSEYLIYGYMLMVLKCWLSLKISRIHLCATVVILCLVFDIFYKTLKVHGVKSLCGIHHWPLLAAVLMQVDVKLISFWLFGTWQNRCKNSDAVCSGKMRLEWLGLAEFNLAIVLLDCIHLWKMINSRFASTWWRCF